MLCISETLPPALKGGDLDITYKNSTLHIINVPSPNYSAEKDSNNTNYEQDTFHDGYGNIYEITIYSSMSDLTYTIEAVKTIDKKNAKIVCDNFKVIFIPSEDFNKDEYKSIATENYKSIIDTDTHFFTIKTSQEQGIKKLLDFFNEKNTDDIFSFGGLTQLYKDVKENSLVFIVAGGDKTKIGFDYTQGLYGVAKVNELPRRRASRYQ